MEQVIQHLNILLSKTKHFPSVFPAEMSLSPLILNIKDSRVLSVTRAEQVAVGSTVACLLIALKLAGGDAAALS